MYSLHDITTVCPKLEPVSDEGECNEEEQSNHSDGNTDTLSEEFPINNNTIQIKMSEYKTTTNGDTSIHEGTTTNGRASYDNISISQSSGLYPEQATARHAGVSVEIPQGQIVNVYTTAPLYENGGHEALYYSVRAADTGTGGQEIYANETDTYEMMVPQPTGAPEGLPGYQSSIYGTLPYVPMTSIGQFSPYQGISLYSGTHRPLTAHEMGIQTKSCCNCPCHLPDSSHEPAFGLKSQRTSVIMVPADRNKNASYDDTSKLESATHRLMTENAKLRRDLQLNGFNEMVDSDSSDEDEDGKEEKYFRVNIDGTTARFKLTKEDWERIPINTFPSGGRLLSGDWTRIFLEKVKESNPWCSLRFKNNHVRSENSRKIHSAVFFRGGAECKRPECNVKVRFVIRKEKGKHVDVTYVGNVCHSSEPGGSDVRNEKKTKQVRRMRMAPGMYE